MSMRPLIALAVAFLVLSASMTAQQQPMAEDNQQQVIVSLEHRWLEAENDPAALESILADDFIHVVPVGLVTKAEQLRYLRSHPAPRNQDTKHFEDLRVRVYGSAAVANGIVVATTAAGNALRTIFTDVFAYRDGKWQAVNAQELPLNTSARP